MFELALSEKKILLVSSSLSMLNIAAESVCTLFFPMTWQHILIPVLPKKLLSYLQAPMPFIIGVSKDSLGPVQMEELGNSDVNIIDLDNDVLMIKDHPSSLPIREKKKLLYRLSKYSPISTLASSYFQSLGSNLNLNINNNISTPSTTASSSLPTRRLKSSRLPITVIEAFPFGKVVPSTTESKCLVISSSAAKSIGSVNSSSRNGKIKRADISIVTNTSSHNTASLPNVSQSDSSGDSSATASTFDISRLSTVSGVVLASSQLSDNNTATSTNNRTSMNSISMLLQRVSKTFHQATAISDGDQSIESSAENTPDIPSPIANSNNYIIENSIRTRDSRILSRSDNDNIHSAIVARKVSNDDASDQQARQISKVNNCVDPSSFLSNLLLNNHFSKSLTFL